MLCIMKKFITFIVIAAASLCAKAQHEFADTLSVKINSPITPTLSTINDSTSRQPTLYEYGERFEEYKDSIGTHTAPTIYFPGYYPGQSSFINWSNGALIAAGQHETMPGLMNRDSAVLNFYQQLGKFSITAYGSASKIGYFGGLSTQWGYGGSLSYQVNDNLSFTAFGSYATKTGIKQPAMLGFLSYPVFGGYADYRFGSSRFGVQAGAQSYYSLGDKHWQTQPIVMPYVRLNNGAKLGIDVGGILYNLIQGYTSNKAMKMPPRIGSRVPLIKK